MKLRSRHSCPRTQTINRLHVVLTRLSPGGFSGTLTAQRAASLLSSIRPRDPAAKAFRALAVDLVSQIRHLDRRIAKASTDIESAVTDCNTTLTELHGIGTISAAKILSHVGSILRFPTAATFATYTGTAPIEVSSGAGVRIRASVALSHCAAGHRGLA
ncbi:transposase [Mycolicibacterium chubuense]|uniref:transposase n=1 Tax=Mycolicibacterium chubuense TaxID=1800 RepID=UPI001300E429|nr:transposase [Mycolicibacterium chubuense]